jgi:hypothetical protein
MLALERAADGGSVAWCKVPAGIQGVLVGAEPGRFFVPPYLGVKGWVGIRLDRRTDWEEVAAMVRRSYRLIAPRRLARLVGEEAARP